MIYVISDTHFGHNNIIKYCDRPFKDAPEMDERMIELWNGTVRPEDTVIHVGDFCFAKISRRTELLSRLNGTKVLVRGNHDDFPAEMMASGFAFVVESMTIFNDGKKFLLSHYPIDPEKARVTILDEIGAAYHIHGHVHNKTPLCYGTRSINVSCENTGFKPVALDILPRLYEANKRVTTVR